MFSLISFVQFFIARAHTHKTNIRHKKQDDSIKCEPSFPLWSQFSDYNSQFHYNWNSSHIFHTHAASHQCGFSCGLREWHLNKILAHVHCKHKASHHLKYFLTGVAEVRFPACVSSHVNSEFPLTERFLHIICKHIFSPVFSDVSSFGTFTYMSHIFLVSLLHWLSLLWLLFMWSFFGFIFVINHFPVFAADISRAREQLLSVWLTVVSLCKLLSLLTAVPLLDLVPAGPDWSSFPGFRASVQWQPPFPPYRHAVVGGLKKTKYMKEMLWSAHLSSPLYWLLS